MSDSTPASLRSLSSLSCDSSCHGLQPEMQQDILRNGIGGVQEQCSWSKDNQNSFVRHLFHKEWLPDLLHMQATSCIYLVNNLKRRFHYFYFYYFYYLFVHNYFYNCIYTHEVKWSSFIKKNHAQIIQSVSSYGTDIRRLINYDRLHKIFQMTYKQTWFRFDSVNRINTYLWRDSRNVIPTCCWSLAAVS